MTDMEGRVMPPVGVMDRLHGLHLVAWQSPERVARELDELGADPNEAMEGGLRALHLAAITPMPAGIQAIEALIEAGADPNASDDMLAPPAFWAARWGEKAAVAELVTKTDEAEDRRDAWGRNIAHWWACGREERGKDSERVLIDCLVDWDQFDEFGAKPVHWAAALAGRVARLVNLAPEMVRMEDRQGFHPIHWAAGAGEVGTCHQLARLGAEASEPIGGIDIRDLLPDSMKDAWPEDGAGGDAKPGMEP